MSTNPELIYIGTGIVAQPNISPSGTIGVYPQQLLADANGNVMDVTDINGMSAADIITAEFRNTDAYSALPPVLAEGDVVTLLQHSDTELVYWQPHNRSLIRQYAKLSSHYPAKKEQDVNDSSDNNYTCHIDTQAGILSFTSTKANDEPLAYSISLGTQSGIFTFQVDNGDVLQWNNKDRKLILLTKDIYIDAPKVHIKGDVSIEGKLTVSKTAQVKGSMSSGGNVSVRGSVAAGLTMRSKVGRFPNLD